jgi:hypothetical protein
MNLPLTQQQAPASNIQMMTSSKKLPPTALASAIGTVLPRHITEDRAQLYFKTHKEISIYM